MAFALDMSDSKTIPNTVRIYFSNFSNKNITISDIPPSVSNTFLYSFAAHCKVCKKHEMYHHNHDYFGEFLTSGVGKQLKSFCEQHKHENEPVKKNPILLVKPESALIVKAGSKKLLDENEEFMSMFDINIGGRKIDSATLPPDILKQVYKLSNFNVDLQAKVSNGVASDYRAICNKCNNWERFSYETLRIDPKNGSVWTELSVFCTKHRHDTVVEDKVGRKFRVD